MQNDSAEAQWQQMKAVTTLDMKIIEFLILILAFLLLLSGFIFMVCMLYLTFLQLFLKTSHCQDDKLQTTNFFLQLLSP